MKAISKYYMQFIASPPTYYNKMQNIRKLHKKNDSEKSDLALEESGDSKNAATKNGFQNFSYYVSMA